MSTFLTLYFQVNLNIEAALAEAHLEFEEAEKELRVKINSAAPSRCKLAATTSLEACHPHETFSSKDDQDLKNRTLKQPTELCDHAGSEKSNESMGHRPRQRPRTNPAATKHRSKFERLPASGHVSSIIGRFESENPEKESTGPGFSNNRKSEYQLSPTRLSVRKTHSLLASKSVAT